MGVYFTIAGTCCGGFISLEFSICCPILLLLAVAGGVHFTGIQYLLGTILLLLAPAGGAHFTGIQHLLGTILLLLAVAGEVHFTGIQHLLGTISLKFSICWVPFYYCW